MTWDEIASQHLRVGDLDIDLEARRASFGDRTFHLSPSQFLVLVALVQNRDKVVSREMLASSAGLAWPRSVDVALSVLRTLLPPNFIRSIPKRGWILVQEALERDGHRRTDQTLQLGTPTAESNAE